MAEHDAVPRVGGAQPFAYDPMSPQVLADPFPAYARLRDECPVHHHASFTPPFFTVTRHDDVTEVLRDVETWSMKYGPSPQYTRGSGLVSDPPEHTEFRRLFIRGFTPRTVGALETELEQIASDLIDRMLPSGRADFHAAFAYPFPMTVIARLLGIPEDDLELFAEMSDDLTRTYNLPDPSVSGPPRARLDAYFQTEIDRRRALLADAGVAEPGEEHLGTVVPNDMISGFVVAEHQGRRLTDHEMQWVLLLLMLGGNETSTALLTNVVWRLLEQPARWAAVRADRSLVDAAIEESLRFDPPVLGLFRTATRDVDLHGVHVPQKSKLMVCYASANRDATHWADPDEFRLDRPLDDVRKHLSFGFGNHFCPGAALARIEGRIALRLLLDRCPELRLAGDTTRIEPFNLWGRATLPLAW
jgi:cytochrome P450